MSVKVTVESCYLRPWINQTPTDEDKPGKCDTVEWACMTHSERDKYVKDKAEKVVEVFT